jgi:hypothetical protein
MWAVVASAKMFCAEACQYYIRNLADDSFSVSISTGDQRVVITPLIASTDPSLIMGCREHPYGKGSVRKEKRYDIRFEDGYVPAPGKEPFISFKNDKGSFRLVFLAKDCAELRSDTASEIHDNLERREYDHSHVCVDGKSYRKEDEYNGPIRHWIVFDSYVAAYCYERYNFPMRCVDIFEALKDNSWISNTKEVDFDLLVGINTPHRYLPPQPKRHWWSELCCGTGGTD